MMKTCKTAIFLVAIVTAVHAQDWSYPLRCPIDNPGPWSLEDLTWQQGTTPRLALEVTRRGRPSDVDTNMVVRMLIAPSATATYYAVATNTAASGTTYTMQWPTVGTNSAGGSWWYTIYFERDGRRYWTGNGDLYIEATTSTAEDGLTWQTVTQPSLPSYSNHVYNTYMRVYEESPGVWKHLLPGETKP